MLLVIGGIAEQAVARDRHDMKHEKEVHVPNPGEYATVGSRAVIVISSASSGSGPVAVTPGTGELALTGFAPSVVSSNT